MIGLCSCDAWACRGAGLVDEVDVEDDIDMEVGRDGRGFEGGLDVLVFVEEDVSRNSAGAIWSSVQPLHGDREEYLWRSMNIGHEFCVLPLAFLQNTQRRGPTLQYPS
jgi:hypothetical protein